MKKSKQEFYDFVMEDEDIAMDTMEDDEAESDFMTGKKNEEKISPKNTKPETKKSIGKKEAEAPPVKPQFVFSGMQPQGSIFQEAFETRRADLLKYVPISDMDPEEGRKIRKKVQEESMEFARQSVEAYMQNQILHLMNHPLRDLMEQIMESVKTFGGSIDPLAAEILAYQLDNFRRQQETPSEDNSEEEEEENENFRRQSFVEQGNKKARTDKTLTREQKLIAKKLGVSENNFMKYGLD